MEENFKKIREKLRNPEKKIGKRLRKFLRNFTLNLRKVCGKFVEFQNNFKIIKSGPGRNHRDQYFEKILT